LVGDIGGTKTDLAVYAYDGSTRTPLVRQAYPTTHYTDLVPLVQKFAQAHGVAPRHAVFAVAGPVVGGEARVTNVPWTLEEARLQGALALEGVTLLNDLVATAHAVPTLAADALLTLNPGEADPQGALAVIAPGTGLGEAFAIRVGDDYVACASEGGHADFAPADDRQGGLWRYIQEQYGHVSIERVCSGSALPMVYDYMRSILYDAELPPVATALADSTDRGPLIVQFAFDPESPSPVCRAVVELFVDILAAEAGNLALKVLSTGGLYIGGGMPLRVLPLLQRPRFLESFVNKGRFAPLLTKMPVHVILRQVALEGAAAYGFARLAQGAT
jgi:glucokinase